MKRSKSRHGKNPNEQTGKPDSAAGLAHAYKYASRADHGSSPDPVPRRHARTPSVHVPIAPRQHRRSSVAHVAYFVEHEQQVYRGHGGGVAAAAAAGGDRRRGRVHVVHVDRQEHDRGDRVVGDVQERQVDAGDGAGDRRPVRRLGQADRLQGHQVGKPHGRDGPGERRRARPRGGVRVRRSNREVEHGADAPQRQPPYHRAEQPAEPLGRVREVGPRTGEEGQRARPVHHTHQVRAAERLQAHRLRYQRHRQGHVRFPG